MSDAVPSAAAKPRHVYLVDGSGFIFRAYHALPPLNRADGTPTNAVLGFVNMLMKLLGETDADHIAVVFDAARLTFRNRIYEAYKAQRPEAPPDLVPQFQLVREATDAFGLCRVESPDFEADDLIATYAREAREAGAEVTIVSSDKDLMQLVGRGVAMFDPLKNKPIGPDEVREKFGVGPEKVVDVQALCGDSVDNVPGVPGIGVKTAAELINQYGSLENLLDRAEEIKQPKRRQNLVENAEKARVSKRLVTLDERVPLPCPLGAMAVKWLDSGKLIAFLKAQDFRKVVQRVEAGQFTLKGAGGAPAGEAGLSVPAAPAAAAAETRYELVRTPDELDWWVKGAYACGTVALHVTSSAPEASLAPLAGIALSFEPGRACYVPLRHGGGDLASPAPEQIDAAAATLRLKALLEDPGVLKVAHNVKYASHVLKGHDIELAPYDCVMLISYVIAGTKHGHGLDELASRHLGIEMKPLKEYVGTGKSLIGFDAVAPERALQHAAEAADAALRLHRLLKPRLVPERMTTFYETIERPMPTVVADMERCGIRVDRDELRRLSADFAERLTAIEADVFRLAGHPFSIGSPKQLGEVLFQELQLGVGGRKGKSGAFSTDVTVLEQLALIHDLPKKVLEWRQLSKLKSTYTDALLAEIHPDTGRVHTSFGLAVTLTGRLSSREPNLQNIPIRTEEGQKIRRCFVSSPGHVLLSADYSQIELRLAAHFADVPTLKEAFRHGHDIHAITASQVFGVPLDKLDGGLRRKAKTINFGILYGISAFGLAQRLGMPQSEAAAYIKAYFERFPGIRDYMERTKAECREKGYVETLFGRRCFIPGIRDGNAMRRQFAEREAINAPLQGSAADVIKRAMGRVPRELKKRGLDNARLLLQVHDELVFEVREEEAERTAAAVKEVMEQACAPARTISVPLVVETGCGTNWESAH